MNASSPSPLDALAQLAAPPVPLPLLFDYVATFIWALSGALIAARRGYVGMGILIIAIASATGGGLLRDALLTRTHVPVLLDDPVYVLLALAAVLLVWNAGRFIDRSTYVSPTVNFVDALAAAVLAVVGVDRATEAGLPFVGIVIVGVINAIGGGLLRDILMQRVPDLFKPGLPFAPASVLASLLFAGLTTLVGVARTEAAFITIAAVSVLDLTMLGLDIRTRPLENFREYWDSRD